MERHNCSNAEVESHGKTSVGLSNYANFIPQNEPAEANLAASNQARALQQIVYIGQRTSEGCTVKRRGETRSILLRLDLRMHSPTGFEWGFAGSGPSQTALAILADFLNDERRALRIYQDFKRAVICMLPEEGWELTGEQIAAAVERLERGDI